MRDDLHISAVLGLGKQTLKPLERTFGRPLSWFDVVDKTKISCTARNGSIIPCSYSL